MEACAWKGIGHSVRSLDMVRFDMRSFPAGWSGVSDESYPLGAERSTSCQFTTASKDAWY